MLEDISIRLSRGQFYIVTTRLLVGSCQTCTFELLYVPLLPSGDRPVKTWSPLASRIPLPLPPTKEKFEALLMWLNSDRQVACQKYEAIQEGLIGIFSAKGFSDAEGLADEAINRVTDRLSEIGPEYEGDPANYFRGVARNIIFEVGRRKEFATDRLPERPTKPVEISDEYRCLMRCLKFVAPEDRELILDYHVYDGADKVANHITMATELKITVNALRVRAYRIRARLEKCVFNCLARNTSNETRPKDID